MDGVQVMAFSLKRVAPSIHSVLHLANMHINEVDAIILHQANSMMIKHLARKIGANESQLALALKDFGNTSSASIPVALSNWLLHSDKTKSNVDLLMSGFGVGWSWATGLWKTSRPNVIEFVRST
jgi:3-oxoacyl-[acyl-carrier-protein] synthase-3